MTTKTQTQTQTKPATKKSLFGLSGKQLRLVVGGSGVIENAPTPN